MLPGALAGVGEEVGTTELLAVTVAGGEWWRDLVVWRTGKGGEVELWADETLRSDILPHSDVDGARAVLRRFGGRLTWTGAAGWRVWTGRVHREDQDGIVDLIALAFADAFQMAIDEVDAVFRRHAEADMTRELDAGKDKAEARKAFKLREKEWRGWMREVVAYGVRLRSDVGQTSLVKRMKVECTYNDADFDADGRWLVVGNGVFDLTMVTRTGALDGVDGGVGVLGGGGGTGEVGGGWMEGVGGTADAVRGRLAGGSGALLLPHSYRRLVTQGTAVEWRGWGAECAWFDWYLARSIPSADLRWYVQKWLGAFLLGGLGGGGAREKALVNLIGESDSGKTLLLNIMKRVWADYVHSVPVEVFLAAGHGGGKGEAGYGKHELKGKRLVVASEPGRGRTMDDSLVKELTGGDPVSSRTLYGKPVVWKPQCLIVISSNFPMRIDTADVAMMRRLRPVEFGVSFSDAPGTPADRLLKRDLEDVIALELPGVMRWCLAGLLGYLREGIAEPAEVTLKRERLAAELESPLQWLGEAVEREEVVLVGADELDRREVMVKDLIPVSVAHRVYREWYRESGLKAGADQGIQRFSKVMARPEAGGEVIKTKEANRFRMRRGPGWRMDVEAGDAAMDWARGRGGPGLHSV